MLIKMTAAPEQELHSASLVYAAGIKYRVGESATDGQIWVTLPKSWLVDATKPEMRALFCEAFENLKFKWSQVWFAKYAFHYVSYNATWTSVHFSEPLEESGFDQHFIAVLAVQ